MAARGVVFVTGDRAIDRRLKALEPRARKKVVRRAMRDAMRPVLAAAKANAPVDTGDLRGQIKLRAARKLKRGRLGVEVRVVRSEAGGGPWYAAAVELGTSRMAARPYMGPAYRTQGPGARDQALLKLREGIYRELKALGGGR